MASPRQSSQDTSVQLVLRMTVAPPSFEASLLFAGRVERSGHPSMPVDAAIGIAALHPSYRNSRDRDAGSTVIASEAKQNPSIPGSQYGLLRSARNDVERASSPHERSDMRG